MSTGLVELNKDKRLALWAARIAECRLGNISVRQWCLEHNISISTYYHWQRKVFNAAHPTLPSCQKNVVASAIGDVVDISAALMPNANMQPMLVFRKADLEATVFEGATPDIIEAICRGLNHA